MVRVEHAAEIARPASEVFAYLANVENLPEWQSGVAEVHADGEVRRGARIRETRGFMGRRVSSTLEVTEYEPPRRFSLRVVEGPVRYEVEHDLAEADGRTRVAIVVRGSAPPGLRFAARALVRGAQRQLETDVERLRQVLDRR